MLEINLCLPLRTDLVAYPGPWVCVSREDTQAPFESTNVLEGTPVAICCLRHLCLSSSGHHMPLGLIAYLFIYTLPYGLALDLLIIFIKHTHTQGALNLDTCKGLWLLSMHLAFPKCTLMRPSSPSHNTIYLVLETDHSKVLPVGRTSSKTMTNIGISGWLPLQGFGRHSPCDYF